MHFRKVTPAEATTAYRDSRKHEQMILPSGAGAIHFMRHPVYGPLATLHTGEAIGLVVADPPTFEDLLPGLPNGPIEVGGADMARLASIAVISLSASL